MNRFIYILFGKHEDDHGNPMCPPLQLLDTESLVISSPSTANGPPEDREGHTASVVGQLIYVFGGTWTDDEDTTLYMNDLHVLDTGNLSWSRPAPSGNPPIEREGHTAAAVGSLIFVFGGTWVDDDDNSTYLNDLFTLDVESTAWAQPETSGDPPMQREGHTASVIGSSRMLIFGGAGLDSEERSVNLNDLHVLDIGTMRWSRPLLQGSVPQERRYHSASVIDQRVLVFGGQYYDATADLHFECDNAICIFDAENNRWSSLAVDDATPLRRACHAVGVVGKRMFLIGGRYWDIAEDDYIFLNDVQILDTQSTSTLATDWGAFINNEYLSDIQISVDGKVVHAHRVVLAARSAYFRGLFESGMRDATSQNVSLDMSYPVFMALLEHLYTDSVEMSPELTLPLFAAADFLGVDHLKAICVARIEADLSVDTVCEALTIADKHLAMSLKETCVSFIVDHFQEVHQMQSFKTLGRDLLDLVHQDLASRLGGLGLGTSPLRAPAYRR